MPCSRPLTPARGLGLAEQNMAEPQVVEACAHQIDKTRALTHNTRTHAV